MINNSQHSENGDKTESIFTTMSRLALEYKAINLGQGFPDFNGPEWLIEEFYQAMKSGKNQYAPSIGIQSLREAMANVHHEQYDLVWNPQDEITVTAGATEALYSSIRALVGVGDEVIIFEPYYDAYLADIELAGARPVVVTLELPDFSFSFEKLEAAVSEKTKMIIINSPHNPTGKVYSEHELEFISKLAVKHDLLVLSDEVYEFMTYDGVKHIPVASYPGMKERTITICSSGKTFGMTGWKIGFAIADKKLSSQIRNIHQWTTFAVNTPGQHAVAYGFNNLKDYLPGFRSEYMAKRDLLFNELLDSAFKPIKPSGSYFIMAIIPQGRWKDDKECAIDLVSNHSLATIPPSVFYTNSDEGTKMLRLCFAKQTETLLEGIKILKKF
jgi:aspartate/methionine/tyrosine aminotransferase